MIAKEPILIYAIHGSRYVFKVLAALQHREIAHCVTFVPIEIDARRKFIPSGGILVPEIKVGTGGSATIVSDSERILHWIDDNYKVGLYPTKEVSELSERASDGILAASVSYYNIVDPKGYKRSLEPSLTKSFPWFVPGPIRSFLVDRQVMGNMRKKKRQEILDAIPGADEALLNDEPAMRRKMIEELEYFQGFLKSPGQSYLLNTKVPTAVDFSVYAQTVRLVAGGTSHGASSDEEVPACCPELTEVSSLARLWQWHDHMKSETFVHFKGQPEPQSMP
eukprot:scaffold3987_cov134-Cylindrotheca_fusiformis.AAC.14